MAEVEFGVVYDGPILEDGRMPVRDLAPALLALGDLFVAASLQAYPEQEPVALDIKATADGSFVVALALHSPDAWETLVHLFSAPPVTALVNLKELVIGSGIGLFWLIKHLRSRAIESEEIAQPGIIRLTFADGTSIEIPSDVLDLYRNIDVRRKARMVVEPLTREGIDRLEFTFEEQVTISIDAQDAIAFEVPEPEAVPLLQSEIEMVVEITSLAFVEGKKWRVSDGTRAFAAAIEDEDFLNRIDLGEPFQKGDMLRCAMRIEQSQRGDGLHSEYHVVRVEEHIKRKVQLQIEDALSSDDPDDNADSD